jgi:hypothetical protein
LPPQDCQPVLLWFSRCPQRSVDLGGGVTVVHGREKGQEGIYGRAGRGQKRRVAAINTKLALEIPAQKAIANLGGDFGTGGSQRSAFRLAAQILPNFPDATEYKAQRENSQHSTKRKYGRHRNPLSNCKPPSACRIRGC